MSQVLRGFGLLDFTKLWAVLAWSMHFEAYEPFILFSIFLGHSKLQIKLWTLNQWIWGVFEELKFDSKTRQEVSLFSRESRRVLQLHPHWVLGGGGAVFSQV
jgi:hypothetical protein